MILNFVGNLSGWSRTNGETRSRGTVAENKRYEACACKCFIYLLLTAPKDFVHMYHIHCIISKFIVAGAFLASVAGISAFVGFGATLAAAKKSDPKYFNKGNYIFNMNRALHICRTCSFLIGTHAESSY